MMNVNECKVEKRTILHRLFPAMHLEAPADEKGFAESYLATHTIVVFDWKDRLRILVSGKVKVDTYTKTDVIVRKSLSTSVAYVLPPNEKVVTA